MSEQASHDPTVPVIELRGVTKTYFNGDLATEVLHGIDLKIYPGEFLAIMGASGSGKSTMMNILGCLDRPTTGEYLFKGRDVSDFDRDELSDLRRESFGFVFQSYNLIGGSTAAENVEVPAMYAGVELHQRHERSRELLTRLGLAERVYFLPNQLSGGQQQRVSISRALMNGGEIILADEPTGALDSKSGIDVMKLLDELSEQGHTVILITHAREVADHARRVIEIRDGNIVADPGPTISKTAPPVRSWTARRGRMSQIATGFESAKSALRALRHNMLRSILTLLGIVIGVASVITMLAIGDGAKKQVMETIGSFGTNLLNVNAGSNNNQRGSDRGSASLTLEDIEAINGLNNVIAAIPYQQSSKTFRFKDRDIRASTIGTSEKFPEVRTWPIAQGTFFTDDDDKAYAAVAVLGRTVADALFPDGENPLGEYILMDNLSFQVIGVLSRKGSSPQGDDQDETVIIPYLTNSLRVTGQRFVSRIQVAAKEVSQIQQTQFDIEDLLTKRHGQVDFRIFNTGAMIDRQVESQDTMTIMLGSIAAISLLVGGIGVMNIMLVSVTERTREIGIRMATGARTGAIMQQFLIEALVVSLIGGAIGVMVGLGAAALVGHFFPRTPIAYTLFPILLAFGSTFAIGLIFGFLPARKAAYLDPVVALQSE
ncbi:MAG: MacB family efflux pump subunit [Steroidobacteraceae bacterium]